ncbi:GNAT family N-acetyltransferase [Williamsia sp. CHRR-6]|uniref:GNAT family N-acetyltransferase n=1 Tax=Williamsia sp. CHRR-6 TaxID=2835871 RepID=UPI001BDAE1A2|nr:GNAT family N-acetyltransferase [Williamsia sp. CHRR-6]MBT0566412.1 GNAT family N-acetyltransferase [Williamsia sp. CHRR-6]
MTASDLVLRRATDDDWPDIIAADARAFMFAEPLDDAAQADLRDKLRNDDVVVVYDESGSHAPVLAGVAMFYRMALTVPGGTRVDLPGLSWVSVAATHRRRGILRMMLCELFDQWEQENSAFSILTASEATIYERFGYGPATSAQRVRVDLRRARLRTPAPIHSPVRYADADLIESVVPTLHDRWAASHPGAILRSPVWWNMIFADRKVRRDGRSTLHYLLHPDGYASYRIAREDGRPLVEVSEFFPITDTAHTDLWQVLLNLDLVTRVEASIPTDDPLPLKLTDLRAPTVTAIDDTMWLRVLDVPAALSARTYPGDLDVVLEVSDEFRSRGGRFSLIVRDGAATVAATDADPTVRMDISVLSSIYLGGFGAGQFAAAGRLWAADPQTLDALDRAFRTDRTPFCGTFF